MTCHPEQQNVILGLEECHPELDSGSKKTEKPPVFY